MSLGFNSLASNQNVAYSSASNKFVLTLKADCSLLLKECDRMQSELELLSNEFQGFSIQLKRQGGQIGFLNRSLVWVKAAIFAVNGHLKSINDLYENCMCLSAKVNLSDDLKKMVEDSQQRYYQLRNRAMGLKTALVAFKNKVQPNLN